MFARSQQASSPLVLPMLGSILTTGIISSILILPPPRPTLSFQQLLLRASFDLTIAVCIHVVTVWCIWRLIREYVEPSVGTLSVHIWAVVVWLPLITTLTAERSLWISCIVPWAFANAITFLNLWSELRHEDEPVAHGGRVFLQLPSTPPLWRALLPYCITVVTMQVGLASLVTGHPWSATALISAGVMLFLMRHPFVQGMAKSRRKFSRFSLLQTAAVFFLISTALTPYLQKSIRPALAGFLSRGTGAPRPACYKTRNWLPLFGCHPHTACKASLAHRAACCFRQNRLLHCSFKARHHSVRWGLLVLQTTGHSPRDRCPYPAGRSHQSQRTLD